MKFSLLLRSIITSLLFIFLLGSIFIQLFLTFIRSNGNNLESKIDRDYVYNKIVDGGSSNFKGKAIKYIDEYINYVFYKRSYPSININDYNNDERSMIENLKNTVSLDYDSIVNIRDLNSIIENNSIYLLSNIIVFTIFLLIWITNNSILKAIKIFGYALCVTAFLFIIISIRIYNNFCMSSNIFMSTVISSIFNISFKKYFYKLFILYLSLGLIIIFGENIVFTLKNKVAFFSKMY